MKKPERPLFVDDKTKEKGRASYDDELQKQLFKTSITSIWNKTEFGSSNPAKPPTPARK